MQFTENAGAARRSITQDQREILHTDKLPIMRMTLRLDGEDNGVGVLPDWAVLIVSLSDFGGEQDIDIAASTHPGFGCCSEGIG